MIHPQFNSPYRVCGFLVELKTPYAIPKGTITRLDPALKESISMHMPRAVCDLTLKPLNMELFLLGHWASFVSWWPDAAASTVRQVTCPACAHEQYTALCIRCKGKRRVVVPIIEGLSRAKARDVALETTKRIVKSLNPKMKQDILDTLCESIVRNKLGI